LVHRLRTLRAQLPVWQHQSASLWGRGWRSGSSGPQEGNREAKGHVMRSLHALEGAELRVRVPARRRTSRRSTHILRSAARWKM